MSYIHVTVPRAEHPFEQVKSAPQQETLRDLLDEAIAISHSIRSASNDISYTLLGPQPDELAHPEKGVEERVAVQQLYQLLQVLDSARVTLNQVRERM